MCAHVAGIIFVIEDRNMVPDPSDRDTTINAFNARGRRLARHVLDERGEVSVDNQQRVLIVQRRSCKVLEVTLKVSRACGVMRDEGQSRAR